MNKIAFFSLLLCSQITFAQMADSSKISPFELCGNWYNSTNEFNANRYRKKTPEIGTLSSSKIDVPVSGQFHHGMIIIQSDGKFIDLNRPNATWKIVDDHLIVTTEFGREIKCFLRKDEVTHLYKLTFEGEIFYKKLGL